MRSTLLLDLSRWYDSHSRVFLEAIFTSAQDRKDNEKAEKEKASTQRSRRNSVSSDSNDLEATISEVSKTKPSKLKQLYLRAKELFDLSASRHAFLAEQR